jgi:long-subunit acyl-CoA synthetase (AMP-forming)
MGAETPQPFAMVTLNQETRDRLDEPGVRAGAEEELGKLLLHVNAQVDPHERLQFIVITDEAWTVASGILTPTMKLKRSVLETSYRGLFDSWSRQQKPIIWHSTGSEESAAQQAAP